MELFDLVNSVIIFGPQITLLGSLTFLIRSLTAFHSLAPLDLIASSDASVCSTVAFAPWEILIMWLSQFPLTFLQNKREAPFHWIPYDYYCADWDAVCNHLRDVPWGDIFKLSASAPSEFCERVQVGIGVYIPNRKYKDKPHSPPLF